MKVKEAVEALTKSNDYVEVRKYHHCEGCYFEKEILYKWRFGYEGPEEEIFDENYGEKEVEEIYASKLGTVCITIY